MAWACLTEGFRLGSVSRLYYINKVEGLALEGRWSKE